jgi:hypothetical protein
MKLLLFPMLLLWLAPDQPMTIERDKDRWKPYYTDTAPATVASTWYLPFDVANRRDPKQIKVVQHFRRPSRQLPEGTCAYRHRHQSLKT